MILRSMKVRVLQVVCILTVPIPDTSMKLQVWPWLVDTTSDSDGNPSPTGKIGMTSIGMSNTSSEFGTL